VQQQVLVDSSQENGLLTQAIGGDAVAMQRLLQLHQPRVLGYVRRHMPARLRHIVDFEDIIQECYFEACRQIERFVPQDKDCFFRWLATIARNHMIDLLRRHRTLKRGGDDQPDEELLQALEELAVHRRTPSKSVARRELVAAIEQALERLPKDCRVAVTLRHLEGLAIADVAVHIGRTERAVSTLIWRGLNALRTDLKSKSNFV
jgi:RNA polymerase sigma-70 factor (ECF subfamily)